MVGKVLSKGLWDKVLERHKWGEQCKKKYSKALTVPLSIIQIIMKWRAYGTTNNLPELDWLYKLDEHTMGICWDWLADACHHNLTSFTQGRHFCQGGKKEVSSLLFALCNKKKALGRLKFLDWTPSALLAKTKPPKTHHTCCEARWWKHHDGGCFSLGWFGFGEDWKEIGYCSVHQNSWWKLAAPC